MRTISILTASAAALLAAPACSDDSTPRLHPLEAACVEYEMSGQMQTGTSVRCHRDYGYEQYEIQNTTIGVAGFTQTQNQHTITIGDTIYAIDLTTNTGTQTVNPVYADIVDALDDASPEEMSDQFLAAMGFTPTGAVKTIAGVGCSVYASNMMGETCITSDGLTLEVNVMGMVQTATSVSIGSEGDAANYTLYQNVPITEGPDLSGGIGGLMDQFQQQQQ